MAGKLFMVRHAQSYYNKVDADFRAGLITSPNYRPGFDADLRDPELTEIGILQAREARNIVSDMHFNKVYVSPLRRALHTAKILFENHPDSPSIIVDPRLTEKCGNSPDIPLFFGEVYDQYRDFDWSRVPRYWYIPDVVNNQYIDRIKHLSFQQAADGLLDIMKEIYPTKVESRQEVIARGNLVKESLKEDLKEGNVAVVAHHAYFKYFTYRVMEDGTVDRKSLYNCQVMEYPYMSELI